MCLELQYRADAEIGRATLVDDVESALGRCPMQAGQPLRSLTPAAKRPGLAAPLEKHREITQAERPPSPPTPTHDIFTILSWKIFLKLTCLWCLLNELLTDATDS